MKGYASTIISTFCRISQTKNIILDSKFIYKLVTDIYTSNQINKKKILFSILTILNYSSEFHKQFIDAKGLDALIYFLNKSDHFLAYISCKCCVVLSRVKGNLVNYLICNIFNLYIFKQ